MKVVYGSANDINNWMNLIRSVSWNFPGLETEDSLEEHKNTVLEFMSKKQAICVKQENVILGVMLFSRKHNMICCLTVLPQYRRNGVASMLLDFALGELNREQDITVSTFQEDDEKGIAPRALYKKYGFVEGELIIEFGYPSQVFVLKGRNINVR